MTVWPSGLNMTRCTMARLIKDIGIAEVMRGKKSKIALQDKLT